MNNKEVDRENYYSGKNTSSFNDIQMPKQQQQVNKFDQEKTKNNLCKKFIHNLCQLQNCPYSHDKTQVRVCTNWKNNTCQKGTNCNFSHPQQQYQQYNNYAQQQNLGKNQLPCKFFYKDGNCQNGENCDFKHGYKICPKYEMGFCPLGPLCEFKHVQKKLCLNYMNGFCPLGPTCNLAHPPTLTQKDLDFTTAFFNQQNKDKNDANSENKSQTDLNKQYGIFRCFACNQYGHKRNKENYNCIIDYDYHKLIFCRLCEKTHKIDEKCKQLEEQMAQDEPDLQQYFAQYQ